MLRFGFHSLKRSKPDKKDSTKKNLKSLAKVTSDGNRFLVARIPIVKKGYVNLFYVVGLRFNK
jgi:Protein of unknown function (DUF3616)